MSDSLPAQREEAHKAVLQMFTASTGLPIGLYEFKGGEPVGLFPNNANEVFEEHCLFIQSLPGGKARCEADQCNRARHVYFSSKPQLTLCHAGLYNQAVPVIVGNQVRGVLLYGEMLIDDEEYLEASLRRHEKTVQEMELDEETAARLRELLLKAKRYTLDQLATYQKTLPRVEEWLYTLFDEEQRMRRSVEKVTHEILTRLQAVIANAENMILEFSDCLPPEGREMLHALLHSALALDTVVQNLGEYMEEYRFRPEPLTPILYEAKRLYEAEAARRGIEIRIRFSHPPIIEMSRHHLQYAFNNLVHNAVKYSFRSGPGRQRYVRIEGYPAGEYYAVVIENYGVGILPEEISSGKIFEDGYQGKLTQGEYRTGSGKGLHFAKRVIERHRGRIEVESRLVAEEDTPEGRPHLNRFTIYLPYRRV